MSAATWSGTTCGRAWCAALKTGKKPGDPDRFILAAHAAWLTLLCRTQSFAGRPGEARVRRKSPDLAAAADRRSPHVRGDLRSARVRGQRPAHSWEEVNRAQSEALRHCDGACSRGSRTVRSGGRNGRLSASVWRARCGRKAGRPRERKLNAKKGPDTFYIPAPTAVFLRLRRSRPPEQAQCC